MRDLENLALVNLFKGYEKIDGENTINKDALKKGIIISSLAPDYVVKEAIHLYGKEGEKWNQTLHKSFDTVVTTDMETLVIQQLVHYFTTYGYEALGIEDGDVYIPKEKLEIPELKEDIPMVHIKMMDVDEIEERLTTLITSGIALSKKTVGYVLELSDYIVTDTEDIKNREVKIAMYDVRGTVPKNADEFLRYVLYKLTGATLKINNDETFSSIKYSGRADECLKYLTTYINKNGISPLAAIYRRNKNFFLAMKHILPSRYSSEEKKNKDICSIINQISRAAYKYHKPLEPQVLDNVLNYSEDELVEALDKATLFREIRILNGLLYKVDHTYPDPIVYRVRNGKSYTTELDMSVRTLKIDKCLDTIYSHMMNRLSQVVKDKTVYIPENVCYMVPSSEKMFNGNVPNGSYIELPRNKDLVYGVHWHNLENSRVDLDLHQSNNNQVFGWDADWTQGSDVVFSGDVTDASGKDGATECFYVDRKVGNNAFLLNLNNFTQNRGNVPFEFVIAEADGRPKDFQMGRMSRRDKNHYVINPNNIIFKWDSEVEPNAYQKSIGMITIGDTIRYYFNDFSNGNGRILNGNINKMTFKYLNDYAKSQLKLRDLLVDAGAVLVSSPTLTMKDIDGNEVEVKVDYDLSLEAITKDSLVELLTL